jgi:hypothetical protein
MLLYFPLTKDQSVPKLGTRVAHVATNEIDERADTLCRKATLRTSVGAGDRPHSFGA